MKITVERDPKISDALATLGEMYIDGQKFCYTLEPGRKDPTRPKGPVPPCIAQIHLLPSPHFNGHFMPHVSNQPDKITLKVGDIVFTYIMIHPLNWPFQTEGCCGIGIEQEKDKLDMSQAAFKLLMPKILIAEQAEGVLIEYVG